MIRYYGVCGYRVKLIRIVCVVGFIILRSSDVNKSLSLFNWIVLTGKLFQSVIVFG